MEVAFCKNMDVSLEWKTWCKLCRGDQLLASGLDFSHWSLSGIGLPPYLECCQ